MSEAITPAQLEAQFGLAHEMAHHGMCIVVPADRFLPGWKPQLKKLGYYIIQAKDLQRKPIILVTREKPEPTHEEEAKSTASTESTPSTSTSVKSNLSAAEWSGPDSERLLKRMAELGGTIEAKCKLLTNEFPGRSQAAIHQKYVKLERAKRKADKAKSEVLAPKQHRKPRENEWLPEDKQRLLKRWNEVKGTATQRATQLVKEFPGRKAQQIYQKHWSLTRSQERPVVEASTPIKPTSVRIVCHTCEGKRVVVEAGWPDAAPVVVRCPECDGTGWVTAELLQYGDNR